MDKLILDAMQFYGYHGVFPEENRLGQKYEVSLVALLDLAPAGQSDDLSLTINYAEVYADVKQIVQGPAVQLIETLAENIATRLLAKYERVQEITVRVKKPNPPFEIYFAGVTVEITRQRH